jgi:CRP-like cAMP-binding protein
MAPQVDLDQTDQGLAANHQAIKVSGMRPAAVPTRGDLDIAEGIPVLSGLKPEALAVLVAQASVVNLRPGQVMLRQGEPAHAFFMIVEGWIKLYRVTPAGDEAVLNVLTTGESLTEAVTFTSGRYPATACAVTRARVVMIPADHVMNCIREMPDIALAMIASTSQHLQRMVQRVEQLTAQSATQRVADFLASLAPCSKGPCTIELPFDKSVIAGRLGLKPESLSRIFAKLRPIGVDVRASHVVVSEMAQLRGLVAGDRTRARGCANGKSVQLAGIRRPPEPGPNQSLA